MKTDDELEAYHLLSHVSYYRLKGYWWDMQSDKEIHLFRNNADFKEVITRYKYDKELRILLFGAIDYRSSFKNKVDISSVSIL